MSKPNETKLEIGSVTFIDTVYGEYPNGVKIKDVSIVYTNNATDYWNSSYEVDIPVDKKQAQDIIEFLQKAFEL